MHLLSTKSRNFVLLKRCRRFCNKDVRYHILIVNTMKNNILHTLAFITILLCTLLSACTSKDKGTPVVNEDKAAKQKMQGTWVNEIEGDAVFSVKGDTLFYNDSLNAPVAFYVRNDSLIIASHKEVRYLITRLNSTQLYFINSNGDEVMLQKSSESPTVAKGEYKGIIDINQGRKIKNDTVVMWNDKRFHAYTQVNPTSYKVYQQTVNDDGMTVENIFYDNIVFIALYDGSKRIYGKNIQKKDFASLVPQAYLESAILSDITIQGATKDGVRFVAILVRPDSYTNYRVNIDITPDGKRKLSI